MLRSIGLLLLAPLAVLAAGPAPQNDMVFMDLPARWDEGVPLGNGMVGALVWGDENVLRFSLDRADLWDLRLVDEVTRKDLTFTWVIEQRLRGDYSQVQHNLDGPYERYPWPTKIPAGRLELNRTGLGEVESVRLHLDRALCVVTWKNGAKLETFVHATKPIGWFRLSGAGQDVVPTIVPPPFGGQSETQGGDSVSGQDLRRLGYAGPKVHEDEGKMTYEQEGWGGFKFAVVCRWTRAADGVLEGVWSVSSTEAVRQPLNAAQNDTETALHRTYQTDYDHHAAWWRTYWWKSFVRVPDPVIQKQWCAEMYKFGAAARKGAPPISLQAVWTADEQRIPPWHGDFHHDLNTQLSYWPCYSGNRLEEGESYLDWLWRYKANAEQWTRHYFGLPGLNFPGVSTLHSEPMGGWIQYSMSPTTAAWLAQHFYWQWRFSMDREFLQSRAYPWLRDTAVFLDRLSVRRDDGNRRLPLSSSPEIHDNSAQAWFLETTNYDLALIRWLYGAASDLARELGRDAEADKWESILREWPELARAEDDNRLLVAPGESLTESHRHFSHLMAIHPLGTVDWENGEADRQTIRAALDELERLGPSQWCGYSYSWLANLAARGRDGERAAEALRIFAECFCLPNTFHANGDQTQSGKSTFTYRPFTLEGNFAFANGVHEMLMQSHTGTIRLFPAVPDSWREVSFERLRAEGAFLVSAEREAGQTVRVRVRSETGGRLRLANPFGERTYTLQGAVSGSIVRKDEIIEINMTPGLEVLLEAPADGISKP